MTRSVRRALLGASALAGLLVTAGLAGASPTTIGTIDNFDVYNNTGQTGRGFEIELEGIDSSDVWYTFGGPYSRYGTPTVVPIPTGVIVRYASPYSGGAFVTGTALPPPSSIPTASGHDCYSGGPIGDYEGSGCEHFGVSLGKAATKTTYRWLVADPSTAGALIADGGTVSLPAPVVTVTPPADPAAPPVVQAVIQAPPAPETPPGGEPQWGEAIWVKIYKIETSDEIELEDLLGGAPIIDAALAEPPEIEWKLLQSPPPGEAAESEEEAGDHGGGDGAVVRRYEFFAYVGPYDPESHEAKADNPDSALCVPTCIGDPIGAQMVGVNFAGGEPVFAPPAPADVPVPASALLLAPAVIGLLRHRRR
ncbi:MAG: PEP-CTERM sorting domain-containing protein [Alphaproteobacteria bacterium]|nr:PEP-CTERM sorting domain-containing protein [Alphaproteobacteria bacterium]